MNFKFALMSLLVVIFAGGSAFAKSDAKLESKSKSVRKVAGEAASDTEIALAHMVISQVLNGKLLASDEAGKAYRGFKKILEGLQYSDYHTEGVICDSALNGVKLCSIRVIILDEESGWSDPHDLRVSISRDGKVTTGEWIRYRKESEGVG
ncbi:MAG: hypothetical protein J7501_13155 [Bdellovibrio sp.]|nr:hypothetical protein [Bdellovibrio sp.]